MNLGDFLDRLPVPYLRARMAGYYRQVFDSPSGRIVLADLCRKGGVMLTHEGWAPDQLQYATGRRDLVLYVMALLRMRPQDLQQIADMEARDE